MIGKIRLTLQFPGDEYPIDVSHLVISRSVSIDSQFCSDEYRSAVDVCRFSLKHNLAIVTKLQAAHARITMIATDYYTAAPIFYGAVEPTAAQSAGQTVGNISLEAADNSWRFDEPIADSFSFPEVIGGSGWYLYNSDAPEASIFHFLAIMAGYLPGDITEASFPEVIPYAAATAEETTYREYLDDLLFEYGYVVHASPSGLLYIASWAHEGETYDEELGPPDLSTVTPVAWSKTAEYRDGAQVVWSEPSVIEDALVFRDSLSVSTDGVFEGEAIAAGDYYPSDSDIEETYQDFVETWLDIPYLSRSTRLKNKDLSLITTSGHVVSFKADAGVVVDYQEFEGLRARVRFRNTNAATARIYWFEIHATALIRLSKNNVIAPEGATNPREYTSQFIMESAPAVKLTRALAMGVAFADFKYTFALNRVVPIGSIVRLVEPRMGIDTRALIQRCAESSDPQTQVTALALTDPTGTTYREWAHIITSNWVAAQGTTKLLEGIAGQPTDHPADVSSLAAKAGKESIVITWDPITGTTVRTTAVGYYLERSQDEGVLWYDVSGVLDDGTIVPTMVTANPFPWEFNRDTDGYPEAVTDNQGYIALDKYRFRIKAVNAAGVASANWTTLEMVDAASYGTWRPSAPVNCVGSTANRTVKLDWADSSVYGLLRYEVQVARESADPSWYEPSLGLDVRASEDNYRQSIVVGAKKHVSISQFTHAVPFAGQNDDPPNPSDTAYIYRVRSVSDRDWTGAEQAGYEKADGGKTAGPWSAVINVLAQANGAEEIVQRSIGQAQIAFGSIFSEHMSAQNLAAVFAYIAALSGGVEDEYNKWVLNDFDGRTKAIGYFRVGGETFGIMVDPATHKVSLLNANVQLNESDLTTFEPVVEDPKRQVIEGLGITIRDTDANGNAELARLEYKGGVGLWGGAKLGGQVFHGAGKTDPYLEPTGAGIIRKETDDYGPKYTLFDGTVLRPSPVTYIQLPGMPEPEDVYGGTWEDVSSIMPGDFMRVKGGLAAAFNGGRQAQQGLLHAHSFSGSVSITDYYVYRTNTLVTLDGTTFNAGGNGNYIGRTSAIRTDSFGGSTGNGGGGSDLRPVNRTVVLWQRVPDAA